MANTNRQIALNYGVIYGVTSVLIVALQYVMGTFTVESAEPNIYMTVLNVILAILFPVLTVIKIKRSNGGYLDFGEGFKAGFTVFVINALFVAAWMLVYTLVLEPEYQEALLNNAYMEMQKQNPNMTEQQLEEGMNWTRKMTSPWMLSLWSVLGGALMGVLISLIVAAIMQNRRPESL